jgi:hypothetical protein
MDASEASEALGVGRVGKTVNFGQEILYESEIALDELLPLCSDAFRVLKELPCASEGEMLSFNHKDQRNWTSVECLEMAILIGSPEKKHYRRSKNTIDF